MADVCNDNRFELIEKYKKKLIIGTNIDTEGVEMLALDNILFRFWQMGWLDIIDAAEKNEQQIPKTGDIISIKHDDSIFLVIDIIGETYILFRYLSRDFQLIPVSLMKTLFIKVFGFKDPKSILKESF